MTKKMEEEERGFRSRGERGGHVVGGLDMKGVATGNRAMGNEKNEKKKRKKKGQGPSLVRYTGRPKRDLP